MAGIRKLDRYMLSIGALCLSATMPATAPVQAQGWSGGQSCRGLDGRARAQCERGRGGNRWQRPGDRHDRERRRHKNAKSDVVAGVVGTVLLGGIIAAAASSGKKDDRERRRRVECEDRYDNYNAQADSYEADDGRDACE